MKPKTFINQFFTVLMCIVVLTMSGGKFWSEKGTSESHQIAKASQKDPVSTSAKVPVEKTIVSELSLNAVITPLLSFDFFQGFYILPEPIWHLLESSEVEVASYAEPHFLITSFSRLFACYIVTNAP